MWISQKINNDREVKQTLNEITKLIRSYADATNIRKEKKVFVIDIGRAFKPRLSTYLSIVLACAVIEALLFIVKILTLPIIDRWISLSLMVSLPILVLGISLATVAKSLSESSRFASEYLKESCQTTAFACITFLTVFWGYLCSIIFAAVESSIALTGLYLLLSSLAVGGTIWCLTSLIYIILEITKCMYPEFSIKAASNYASRKLSYAFLKDMYLATWMGKYSEILDEELKKLKNIHPFYKHWSENILQNREEKNTESSESRVNLRKAIDFHIGYRDFNINELKKIDKLLGSENAKLYLASHGSNPKELGVLCYEEKNAKVRDTINKKVSSICRFRRDKHVEEEDRFWEENYLKMRSALMEATKGADMVQFREYLKSIEDIYGVVRKARKLALVRKPFDFGYKKARYLFIYTKSVRWLLENTQIEEDVRESLLNALVESIWQQVRDEIRNGDWRALDIFKWLLPEAYQSFVQLVKDKKSRLWELRARIGSFYDFTGSLISQYESELKEEDKLQIQLVLHKGIIKWLLVAIDNKDDELIKSLCGAAKELVFPDKKMTFVPRQLVIQHFILCGKMLEFVMGETPHVPPSILKLLCFDKYERTIRMNINYDELVKFFIESRKEPGLSDYLREFSSTDWKKNPLSGGGFGTPHYTFSGNIELDYMFIYLALLCMRTVSEVQPIAFEFECYQLKEKMEKFRGIAGNIGIYSFEGARKKLEGLLNECDQLYVQKEEEQIATAPLDREIVSKYKDAFWEGYKSVKTFLDFCIRQGHYSINEGVNIKRRYNRRKDIFIDESMAPSSVARRDGADIASYCDKDLLKKMINSDVECATETVDDVKAMLNRTCQWLTKEGTNRENGVLLFYGSAHIQSELYNNEYYVPSWKEDTNAVFSGYYKNYPMIEIYEADGSPKCVGLNLRGWKGLEIRPEVRDGEAFGVLNIREWTESEINEAIQNEKITEKDVNRVKGQCPVEYELFWGLDGNQLPDEMIVCLKTEDGTS